MNLNIILILFLTISNADDLIHISLLFGSTFVEKNGLKAKPKYKIGSTNVFFLNE
jgi:hypothetical protein